MPTLPENKSQKETGSGPLPARLAAIAAGLPAEGVICDVGSDHGLLPLHLLKERQDRRVVVTDVNAMPLSRARAAIEAAGCGDRALFYLADGIASLETETIAAFVIAGMSGETIAAILEEGKTVIRPGHRFLLQPMTHEEKLRAHLTSSGFVITEETVVRERERLFLILSAEYCGAQPLLSDPVRDAVGTYLPRNPGEHGRAYLEEKRRKLRRILQQRSAAQISADEEETLLDEIEKILKELP